MKKYHVLPLAFWTILWAGFYWTLLFQIDRLPNTDFSGQFHTFGTFEGREMAAGHLSLWSPGSYSGVPIAADPQAAVFYPLDWLTILFSLPVGFTYFTLELEVLLHIWLVGVFAYLLIFDIFINRTQRFNLGKTKSKLWLTPAQ